MRMLPYLPATRKRRVLDEKMPSGESINDAVLRLTRREPIPQEAIANVPQTDSLPAIGLRPQAIEEALNYSPTRVKPFTLSSDEAPLLSQPIPGAPNMSRIPPETIERAIKPLLNPNQPIEDNQIGMTARAPALRALEPYDPNAPPPPSMVADPNASRERLTQPVNPLLKALENYNAIQAAPLDYGQHKYGNQRTHAKEGWGGRTLSGLKRFGKGMLRGEGLLGAGADAIQGIIDPGINARERRQGEVARAAQNATNQIGIARAQGNIESDRIMNAIRQDDLRRGPLDRQTKADELERDNLRGIYTNLDDFDPIKNPQHKQIADRAQALSMILPAKAKGERAKPRWKNEGLWWTLDDSGQTAPLIDPQTKEQMVDRPERPVTVNDSSGTPRIVSQTTALNADATRENRKYQRGRDEQSDQWRTDTWNKSEQDRYVKEKESYDEAVSFNDDLARRIAEKHREMQGEQANSVNPAIDEDLRKEHRKRVIELRDQIGQLEGQKKTARAPRPPQAAPNAAPSTRSAAPQGRGKYSGQRFASPESIQQAFPGKSPAEIRRIVESNGGVFQ